MNTCRKLTAMLLITAMLLSLGGCALTKDEVMALLAPTHEEQNTEVETVTPTEQTVEVQENLKVYADLSGCFSPFYAETKGDRAVTDAVQLHLSELDDGAITAGENEDGSYTVTVELPGNLRSSDGEPLLIDDLLFTLYVLLDESYEGSLSLRGYGVAGLEEYYNGVDAKHWEEYSALFDELYNEGRYDEDLIKNLKEKQVAQPYNDVHERMAQEALDAYDQEKAAQIRQALMDEWREDADRLVDYCMEKFAATVEYHTGYTAEQLRENRGLQVMYAMVELSFGSLLDNGTLLAKKTGSSWDMVNTFPTVDDFYNEMVESYGGSAETYWAIEGIGRGDILEMARRRTARLWAKENGVGTVDRIPGIVRVGDRMATITFNAMSVEALKAVTELPLVPLHFYGVEDLYDYAAGSYGFPKGNVSALPYEPGTAMGAGEYVLSEYSEGRAVLTQRETGEELILATAAG